MLWQLAKGHNLDTTGEPGQLLLAIYGIDLPASFTGSYGCDVNESSQPLLNLLVQTPSIRCLPNILMLLHNMVMVSELSKISALSCNYKLLNYKYSTTYILINYLHHKCINLYWSSYTPFPHGRILQN